MKDKLAIVSDIHGNVTALNAVISDMKKEGVSSVVLLGDIIDYGPRSNEAIEVVRNFPFPVLGSIWGNHEYAIFQGNLESFATDRGRSSLEFTKRQLTEESSSYLQSLGSSGKQILPFEGSLFLLVHGTMDDPYWGKFKATDFLDDSYAMYDYVLSGHSHLSHYFESFFPADNPMYRNKRRTIFINPGSVGQPRNHNPYAQYGLLDLPSGSYEHRAVWYDVEVEQKLFSDSVDKFYKERLTLGI